MRCDNPAMEITPQCVVALTWTLRDSLGETLDELQEPVEFLVGTGDLLPAIDDALQGHAAGATLQLALEPEQAFGDYDETQVHLLSRQALPEGIEEGMLLEVGTLPAGSVPGAAPDALLTITEIYPEHVVLDGNHPLAGIALRLTLKVVAVREATLDEVGRGSAGTGFFRLQPMAPGNETRH